VPLGFGRCAAPVSCARPVVPRRGRSALLPCVNRASKARAVTLWHLPLPGSDGSPAACSGREEDSCCRPAPQPSPRRANPSSLLLPQSLHLRTAWGTGNTARVPAEAFHGSAPSRLGWRRPTASLINGNVRLESESTRRCGKKDVSARPPKSLVYKSVYKLMTNKQTHLCVRAKHETL